MILDVLCLGEPLLEFNQIKEGNKKTYSSGYGGDTSNTAISIARQGMSVGFISKVGKDQFGWELLELWKREKVDYSHVSIHPEAPTGIYFVTHDADGHHFTYYRSGSAACQMTPLDLPKDDLSQTRILHLSAITQAISVSSCETAFAAIFQARKNGVKVSYDTNLRLKLWSLDRARDVINRTVPMCDVIMPSLEEATSLTGLVDPEEITDYFFELGAKLVVLKQGSHGARVSDGKENLNIPGHKVKAIDATGAGDTFDGAFLSEWIRKDDPFSAAEYANAAAALSTTNYGAVDSIPNRDEVKEFLGFSI
jgi:2-dehydro-3-deoxygluconokinase|tara:strand:+ start:772 stop:1698 length:927 start_codon:yes stop_codon:yes gene_type:complete